MDSTRKDIRETVAKKLKLFHSTTIEDVDADGDMNDTLMLCSNLADISRDPEHWRDAFLYASELIPPEWRRIVSYNEDALQAAINREFDAPPPPPSAAQVYLVLNPDEFNDAINEVLIRLYTKWREEITIVDGQREYTLPSWIQHKGMVVGVRWRNTTTFVEDPIVRYRLDAFGDTVTLHLMDDPRSETQYTIVVEGHRYYNALTQDASSDPDPGEDDLGVTTCPMQLWLPAVTASVIHKIIHGFGDRWKKLYAQDLAIAEREFINARAELLPLVQPQEYNVDEDSSLAMAENELFFRSGNWV